MSLPEFAPESFPSPAAPARPARRVLTMILLAGAHVAQADSPLAFSTHYTLHTAADSSGAGWIRSSSYVAFVSTGQPGAWTASTEPPYRLATGFVPTLNDPPEPTADTLSRAPGLTAKVHTLQLLRNDTDPEEDPVRVAGHADRSAAGGRIYFDHGWILYEPPEHQPPLDSFTYTVEDTAGHLTSQTVFVTVSGPDLTPSQNLVRIQLLPNGQRHLVFAAIPGRTYAIEWTDTLPASRWELLAILEADPRGLLQWVDATDPPPPIRFYRTVPR